MNTTKPKGWGTPQDSSWPVTYTAEREYEPVGSSLEYERYVELPRRQGRDPVWESMLTEALNNSGYPLALHRAG